MTLDKPIEVVIADDNIFLAKALAENLNNSEDIHVSNTFEDIQTLVKYIPNSSFDILILDINFNGQSSLDFIDQIKSERTDFKIIALTTLNNSFIKQEAQKKGIDLFKGKNTAYENFDQVIIDCYTAQGFNKNNSNSTSYFIDDVRFTQTKIKVIKGLYNHSGKTETEIANILNISTSALKTHKRQLFEMTNTSKIVDLIKFGLKNGILIS